MSPHETQNQPAQSSATLSQASAEMEALLRGLEKSEITPDTALRGSGKRPESRFSFAWFFLVFWLTLILTLIISWNMIV